MAKVTFKNGKKLILSSPKNTRQGASRNTKLAATSRNGRGKRYKGQGRWSTFLLVSTYSVFYVKLFIIGRGHNKNTFLSPLTLNDWQISIYVIK